MADFKGTVLTQKGRDLLSKAQAGVALNFTKIKIGDGTWATDTDPTQLNDLVNPKLSLPIQTIQVVGDGTVRLRFVLANTGLQQGFFMREIGIYAQDPDLGEILYAVAYASDRADFIPADGVTKVENVVDIYTVIANTQNVTAVISDTVVIATKQDVDNLNTQLTNQINTVNTQLTTQINTVKPELGTTAPSLTYPGKLWFNTNNSFLQYFDGSNWQNVMVSNADKVDGYHASLSPAPNVIVPLDVNGVLDLSATYVKSNVYTFRRVDLTNATSDYMLQVGEEAIISFNNIALVDFHIAVPEPASVSQPVVYEITIMILSGAASNYDLLIYPNKTTYSNAFNVMRIGARYDSSTWSVEVTGDQTKSVFYFDMQAGILDTAPTTVILIATYWGKSNWKSMVGYGGNIGGLMLGSVVWKDTVTQWSSLGRFSIGANDKNITGTAIVRRVA